MSTAWNQTSLTRMNGTAVAGIVRPCMLRTTRVHAAVSNVPSVRARDCAVARTSSSWTSDGRAASRSMSAPRASTLGYIGVSTPVRAQVSSRSTPSALRAMCATTCPFVQSGNPDGAARSTSSAWSRNAAVPGAIHSTLWVTVGGMARP